MMKISLCVLATCLVLAGCARDQQALTAHERTDDDITCRIRLKKGAKYLIGEPIDVEVELSNRGQEPFSVRTPLIAYSRFGVVGADGKGLRRPGCSIPLRHPRTEVGPGETCTVKAGRLTRHFKLDAPGKYELRLKIDVVGRGLGRLSKLSKVAFSIVMPEGQFSHEESVKVPWKDDGSQSHELQWHVFSQYTLGNGRLVHAIYAREKTTSIFVRVGTSLSWEAIDCVVDRDGAVHLLYPSEIREGRAVYVYVHMVVSKAGVLRRAGVYTAQKKPWPRFGTAVSVRNAEPASPMEGTTKPEKKQ